MATVQWRPVVNALTIPQSYKIRFVPRNIVGNKDLIAEIARRQPNLSEEVIRTVLDTKDELIEEHLVNGDQITLKGAFTYTLSFLGRLDGPEDPLPDRPDLIQFRVNPSPSLVRRLRYRIRLERLGLKERLPLISSVRDTGFKLVDVLNPLGALRVRGNNLLFNAEDAACGCVIEGTRQGRIEQSRYIQVSNRLILLVPDIPVQPDPWNNEYVFSMQTRYSEHGAVRTTAYAHRLRVPLLVQGFDQPDPPEVGILTGMAESPAVCITGVLAGADERIRIQAILDGWEGALRINLTPMKERASGGPAILVPANGTYTLEGPPGSAVTSLTIRVDDHAGLKDLIRTHYAGFLVDILDIRAAG